ncbi:MAG: hypothetical protein ABWK53_03395 [Anaerolineales bacterium]
MMTSLPPEQLADEARRLYQGGDFTAAAEAYGRAAEAYAARPDALMAAEMRNNQAVSLLQARQPQAALAAVQGTDLVFEQAGDLKRQGMALANLAGALEALKRRKEAMECYRRAADVLEKADEGDLRVEIMQLLAMDYLRRGKFFDAVLALQSGMAGVKNPTPRQKLFKKLLFLRLWR